MRIGFTGTQKEVSRVMTLEEAKEICASPGGHSKAELFECLRILNALPLELSPLQGLAIQDAHKRLGVLLREVRE